MTVISREENKAVIKDVVFESVLLGRDVVSVLRFLHFEAGYDRELIMEALSDMERELS